MFSLLQGSLGCVVLWVIVIDGLVVSVLLVWCAMLFVVLLLLLFCWFVLGCCLSVVCLMVWLVVV